MSLKVRENRIRRAAARQGLRVQKSRRRDERALTYGGYWLVDQDAVVVGGDYGCGIDEIEDALNRPRKREPMST